MPIVEYFEKLTGFKPIPEQAETLKALTDDSIKNLILCMGRGFSKSLLCSVVVLWYAEKSVETGMPIRIMMVSPQDTMYKYVNQYFSTELLKANLVQKGIFTEIPVEGFKLKNNTEVFTKPPTNKVRSSRSDILFIDEAADVSREILHSASMCLTGASPNRIILLSTPHKEGEFTDLVRTPEKFGYVVKVYSSRVCPWCKQTIERAELQHSKAEKKIEIDAQIPTLSELQFFSNKLLEKWIQPVEFARIYPDSSLEAGIDWGYEEPTVLTISEKGGVKRKVIYQKAWRHEPIESLAPKVAEALKGFRMHESSNVVRADSLPVDYRGQVEKHYPELYIHYLNLKDHRGSMLEQLRNKKTNLLIPSKLVDLVIQLRKFKLEDLRGDDLVISLALSCYEYTVPRSHKAGRIFFPEGFDREGGAVEYQGRSSR